MASQNKIISLSVVALLLIGIIVFFFTQNDSAVLSNKKAADKNTLIGDWVRTDAEYLIRITQVNDDGTMSAQYFNPNPIYVGKANWEASYGNLKIIVEMRDVNYPGSTYTLNYLHDRDMLAGEYYQAVEGLTFYVEFTRSQM
jgi:ascorbate-specific PTS system EIIC-type component UlaA